jgi:hypothetical protein
VSAILVREDELLTVVCDSEQDAQTIKDAVISALEALGVPAPVYVWADGGLVKMTGDLATADGALCVALDMDETLPHVIGVTP